MFPLPIEFWKVHVKVLYALLVLLALAVWIVPLAAVFLTSIRTLEDINHGNMWGMPTTFAMVENYTTIFVSTKIGRYLINSLIITLSVCSVAVVLASMAGFALSKYNFRGRNLIFVLFVAGNFAPFQILMIPVRNITMSLGFYDTMWALIIFHISFQVGFCVLFMRSFISQIDNALIEAARIEGISDWKIFLYIIFPLSKPALAALSVLTFTFVWNDYFWALILVQSDTVRPITAGLSSLSGQWIAAWHLISAGSIIAALPTVVLFFAMQKYFIAGLTMGSTKG